MSDTHTSQEADSTPHPGPLPGRGGEGASRTVNYQRGVRREPDAPQGRNPAARLVQGAVHRGGRLPAFAYRFGNTFPQTNLRDRFAQFGVPFNNHAVINLDNVRSMHQLRSQFPTGPEWLPATKVH